MFSRPVRSCWKPAPSSSRPASLPRTATSPSAGCSTPQMHLSRVDLPEPLRPRMPTVSPSRTVSETSSRAQKSSVDLRLPPWIRRSLTVLYWPWARRKRLETSRTWTAKSLTRSELLGEVALETAQGGEGDDEQHQPEDEDDADEGGVPEVPVLGQDLRDGAADDCTRLVVEAALEGQDERRHGIGQI